MGHRAWIFALAIVAFVSTMLTSRAAASESTTDSVTNEPSRVRWIWHFNWHDGLMIEQYSRGPLPVINPSPWKAKERRLRAKVGLTLNLDATTYEEEDRIEKIPDGVGIRRSLLSLQGDYFLGFKQEYKLEFDTDGHHFFIGEEYLRFPSVPYAGRLTVGNFKVPLTMEATMGSQHRPLMESAAPIEAFAPGYKSGVSVGNAFADRRATWATGIFAVGARQDVGDASEESFRLVGRATCRPLVFGKDAAEGYMHLGASVSLLDDPSGEITIQYRSRPESYLAPHLVDTGDIASHRSVVNGIEAAFARGPWFLASELVLANVDSMEGGRLDFKGGYVETSCLLTGETRPYDAVNGVPGRVTPARNFSWRGGDWGAFELTARYSWLDLQDREIRGGVMNIGMGGLTWHLNRQARLMLNAGLANVDGRPESGQVFIAQIRLALEI